MSKKQSFEDSLSRAKYAHKNSDLGGERIEKLEEVVSHLITCLEEIQKATRSLGE